MTIQDFNILILPLKNKLFRFALSVLANRPLAEDVVQEAFIKLWTKRDNLDEIENLEAWCMRMVKNLCLDSFKSKHNKHNSEEPDANSLAFTNTPHKQTELSDTVQQVYSLMDQLPEQQRQIIQLRDVEEYAYKEIAEILEIDINIVKVNLHRARKTIRQQLEKNEAYGL